MFPSDPRYRKAMQCLETLLIAAGGAILFVWIHFPAALICGSILAVAVAALWGRTTTVPAPLARIVFIVVGISIGATVTPQTLHGVVDWPLSILIISISALCMTLGAMTYLRTVHRWSPDSALYGASPGGMAQVIALAQHSGADIRGVVIVQTVRVIFLAVGLPGGLALFGLMAPPTASLGASAFTASWTDIGILAGFSTLTAFALRWINFPASMVFGAMLGSGILHGSGFMHANLPTWIVSPAIVAMGATVGARFANTPARMLFGYLGAALGSFAVAVAIATAFAVLVAKLTTTPIADLVIAFAPGAQDTMMVLALSLNIDPVFVGAHQLARFLSVSLSLPLFARLFTGAPKDHTRKADRMPPEK
ncbi:MAG TPA: AbrB family transcriptional regulator [Xanthobacteraceae bacterium]|nr:AbrB family transcriptional regulator [Xanthobacteraceae bacterium]